MFVVLLIMAASSVYTAPLSVVDLASNTAWTLSVDGGAVRTIKVPAGGYNSDMQDKPYIDMSIDLPGCLNNYKNMVNDHVEYMRKIQIPNVAAGQVTLLEFGAVNHGCEVFINGQKVGEHFGPNMPFEIDITDIVAPGNTYDLKVVSYPQKHYMYTMPMGYYYTEAYHGSPTWNWDGWTTRFAFGIARYVKIAVYSPVYIKDIFVRPSVKSASLSCDIRVYNHTSTSKAVSLEGVLSSWNGDFWVYPAIPKTDITIGADSEKKITCGPLPWNLGAKSYWWPNKPFREDYKAQLHNLSVSVKEGATILDAEKQRFGFVEWGEGPYYYTVNGVRVNHISDATPEPHMTRYDGYTNTPAFLPPTASCKGFPETLRRYMRIGINTNRMHQSTATPYMMDVADELGFMFVAETGIRGGGHTQTWHDVYMPMHVKDLARVYRNHPSTCRYSLSNEWFHETRLIDTIVTVDNTRPLVFEGQSSFVKYTGASGYHACMMPHYTAYPKPATVISGIGEDETGDNGLEPSCWKATDGRYWDLAYYSGWCWLNYWPNFLEGMDRASYAYKASTWTDRKNGVDGWGSLLIHWVQQNFHPYLVMDYGIHTANSFKAGSTVPADWPRNTASYTAGATITRDIVLFNDGFAGDTFTLLWEARWDRADGALAATDSVSSVYVQNGFHVKKSVSFKAPVEKNAVSPIPIVDRTNVFEEKRLHFNVSGRKLYWVLRSYLHNGNDPTAVTDSKIPVNGLQGKSVSIFKIVNGRCAGLQKQSGNKMVVISVYDLHGRIVYSALTKNPVSELKSNFYASKGMYIVSVQN